MKLQMNFYLSVRIQVFDAIHTFIDNFFTISTTSPFIILPTECPIITRVIQILVIMYRTVAFTARGGELAHNYRFIQFVFTGLVFERTIGRILTFPGVTVQLIEVCVRDKNKHNYIMNNVHVTKGRGHTWPRRV